MSEPLPASPEAIGHAQQQGRSAALKGQPVSACPYRLKGQESVAESEETRFLQLMWIRGYRHARAQLDAARES